MVKVIIKDAFGIDNWYHQVCAITPLDDDMFWHCTFCVAINTM